MVIVIVVIILAFAVALGVVMALEAKKRAKEGTTTKPNYGGLYKIGIILIIFSIVAMVVMFGFQIPFYIGLPLLIIGLMYVIAGRINIAKREE
ncbi:hypothetical protein ACFLXZ_00380 [Chloroflexota bacterium]